jgi:hypothetical protein
MHDYGLVKLVGKTESAPYVVIPENFDPSGSRATVILKGPTGSPATVAADGSE